MLLTSTLDKFFSAPFAEDVIYTAYKQVPATIKGIFDLPGSIQTIGAVSTYIEKPQVKVKSSDVPTISKDDTFEIRSVVYKVAGPPQPDGTGISLVILKVSE